MNKNNRIFASPIVFNGYCDARANDTLDFPHLSFCIKLIISVRIVGSCPRKNDRFSCSLSRGTFNSPSIKIFNKMGELGILGITVPENYGGAAMDCVAATLVMEEIGAVCASTALSYLAHSILAVHNLNQKTIHVRSFDREKRL